MLRLTVGSYPIMECRTCQHSYLGANIEDDHIDRHYGDDYFFAGGAGYSDYLASGALLKRHGERYAKNVVSRLGVEGREKTLFAVGAAAGFDLLGFRETGWQVSGLEPNPTMVQYAIDQLKIPLVCGPLESFVVSQRFDLVLALQVVAHFVDLSVAAERLSQLVKPGGHLLIETWNYRSLTARLFGRRWHEYSPPTVLQWFTPHSLQRWLSPVGFRPVEQGRPTKRISGQHAAGLLRYKLAELPGGSWLSRSTRFIPSSLEIPYPSEDLFWMIFQRQ